MILNLEGLRSFLMDWLKRAQSSINRLLIIILTGVLLTSLLLFFNYHFLVKLIPYVNHDFMSFWAGGRAMLEKMDPYDPEEWASLFGRYGSDWISNPQSLYPIWTTILFAPFALIRLDYSVSLWLAMSELILGFCSFLLLNLSGHFRFRGLDIFIILCSSFLFRGTVSTLTSGQITFLLVLVITVFLFFVRRAEYFLAGFVLAFISIKPNPFILFAPAMVIWLIARRYWRAIAGALTGVTSLFVLGWMVDPGWFVKWLNVREKTILTYQTSTVWGLSYEISPTSWFWHGLGLTVIIIVAIGWLVVSKPMLDVEEVASLALAFSLFVTPYTWPYDHALLLVPLIIVYPAMNRSWIRILLWVVFVFVLPWILFYVAEQRGTDTLSCFVPLLVGLIYLILISEIPGVQNRKHNCLHS
jgi:hypothetical protein